MRYPNRDELIEQAKKLKKQGCSYSEIARHLGVSNHKTISYWLDPKIRERMRVYQRENRDKLRAYKKEYHERNKEVICARSKAWYENNKKHARETRKKYWEAHREEMCAYLKDYHENHKEEHREKSKLYREANKDKIREGKRQYRESNKEKIAEKKKAYHEANREAICERSRQWYKDNKERALAACKQYYEANKEKMAAAKQRYYQNHKEEQRECNRRRKQRIAAGDTIRRSQYSSLFDKQQGLCAYCGKKMKTDGDYLHRDFCTVEHIIPISRNGQHTIDNIVFACRKCNTSKGTKLLEEWRPELLPKIGNGVSGQQTEKAKVQEQLCLALSN